MTIIDDESLPSKELLSEVLHQNITAFSIKGNTLFYQCTDYFDDCINIYELVHRCKEWAWSKSYASNSIIFVDFESNKVYLCAITIADELNWKKFEADTEHEAIFKACEWILKATHD